MKQTPFQSVLLIGSLWAGATIGFYLFLPVLGLSLSYNATPVGIALYYLVWIGIALYACEDVWRARARPEWIYGIIGSAVFGMCAGGFVWFFAGTTAPAIPDYGQATDLLLATPWYFLPKSVEILFQQILIAAFVYRLSDSLSLRQIVLWYAILFGGAHILLLLGGSFPPAVLIMTLSAVASAAFFPYVLLRIRYGFVYAYITHWLFYAVLSLLLRLASS